MTTLPSPGATCRSKKRSLGCALRPRGTGFAYGALVMVVMLAAPAAAQELSVDTATVRLVILNDGRELVGTIAEADRRTITVRSANGVVTEMSRNSILSAAEVYRFVEGPPVPQQKGLDTLMHNFRLLGDVTLTGRKIQSKDSLLLVRRYDGRLVRVPWNAIESWDELPGYHGTPGATGTSREDPNDFALFLAPTGRGQNGVSIGCSDFIIGSASVGIGNIVTLSVHGTSAGGIGVFKLSVPSNGGVYFSAGVAMTFVSDAVPIPFIATTFGNDDVSLTTDVLFGEDAQMVIIGGEIRVGARVKLLSEVYISAMTGPMFFGCRYFHRPGISFELGFMYFGNSFDTNSGHHDERFILPWATLHYAI